MDIVDQILKKIKPLYEPYKDDISYYYDEGEWHPELEVHLERKLGCLARALKIYMGSNNFHPQDLKKALDMIENFVREADERTQGMVEIMFLEGLWWWATDKEWEASKKYGDYFFECLGPTCLRLVRENKAFWDKLNRERQKEIDEKYAQMQRDYEERKRLGEE
jgi:hypothetical protein